jgi:hypothetical protein
VSRLLAAVALLFALAACQAPNTPAVTAPSLAHAATASSGTCHAVAGKADRSCTPGAINQQVTQLNISSTICRTGWTATIRPPVSYTNRLKAQQMSAYGLRGPPSQVEEDHLVALEIGGNPTDPQNLWPQLWNGPTGAHAKDVEENSLHRAVCGGRMKLAAAQAKMVADWTHA